MNCKDCRWHFALNEKLEGTGWKNCMALPYPQCYSLTHISAECPVPELFEPLGEKHEKKTSLAVVAGDD